MVFRVNVTLTGFNGAPGLATFYTTNLDTMRAALTNLWGGVGPTMPTGLTHQIASEGDIIDSATGALTGSWSRPNIDPTGSGGGPAYAGPSGATISWLTGVVADGRRVKGRTFIVPLASGSYDTDGTIGAGARTALRDAAAAFVIAASPGFVVWHRPFPGRPASGTLPARAAHPGLDCIVNGSVVPDKAAVLRSRRD